MGGSTVQGSEEQLGGLGSGFGLPQTLCMNQEDRIGTRRGPCAFFVQETSKLGVSEAPGHIQKADGR